jgi:Right handed beta helix region
MSTTGSKGTPRRRRVAIGATAAAAGLLLPAVALAHLERPSYWPDPAPDTSVSPAAGGKVPDARSLASALQTAPPGNTRVVCQGKKGKDSLKLLKDSVKQARKEGFRLRPSQPIQTLSNHQANELSKLNRDLARMCAFHSIQTAINASGNNDRVVIMPGTYTEPASRAKPTNDPACAHLTQEDSSGAETPSYEYQVTCPNDQNLIYVQGRALAGDPPSPPLSNRHGIPDEGACVRCNLQIEGSGVKPEDVILDAGIGYVGSGPTARPTDYAKHVILRVDRADGFVGRNFLTRGALEFGFYSEETDGVLLDRVKFFWAADYGHLSFTTDHNEVRNCEGFGSGDSVVYPGGAPETGAQADLSFYPDAPRINTVITKCDLHGSALGYSGSMGNAVRITDNHVYGNTTGISSDTLSAAGHPGFPADGSEIDHNYIYSNNLNLYVDDPPVESVVPVPIGAGILYTGMNDARVHHNWIFDNWRNGTMLLGIPDAVVSGGGPEGDVNPGISCATAALGVSTSCNNRFFNNRMGQVPPGFKFPAALDMFGAPHGSGSGPLPNGIDFWWNEFTGNTGNCWFDNTGPDGTESSVTGPGPGDPPDVLPSDCATSVAPGDLTKLLILLDCSEGPDDETGPLDCDWWQPPAQPTSALALQQQRQLERAARRFQTTDEAQALRERMAEFGLADRG